MKAKYDDGWQPTTPKKLFLWVAVLLPASITFIIVFGWLMRELTG